MGSIVRRTCFDGILFISAPAAALSGTLRLSFLDSMLGCLHLDGVRIKVWVPRSLFQGIPLPALLALISPLWSLLLFQSLESRINTMSGSSLICKLRPSLTGSNWLTA